MEHFTIKEAERRDGIVAGYFGRSGINRIAKTVADFLLAPPRLQADAKVLDVGAGSGFFTAKIADKIHVRLPKVSFYAMDAAPAMPLAFARKKADITPFIGLTENIEGSIMEARKYADNPREFDAVFSTLMLHHSAQPENVFKSIKKVLKEEGKAVILDLCEHSFEEFKTEMGDLHLGFKPENIHEVARKHLQKLKLRKCLEFVANAQGAQQKSSPCICRNFHCIYLSLTSGFRHSKTMEDAQ